MKKSFLSILLVFSGIGAKAQNSMDLKLERLRVQDLRMTGKLDGHKEVEFVLNHIESLNHTLLDVREDILKNLDRYKKFKGLLRVADKYFKGDAYEAKSVLVYILTDKELEKLKWQKPALTLIANFVRDQYFLGNNERLQKSVDKANFGETTIDKILEHPKISVIQAMRWLRNIAEYENVNVTASELNELKKSFTNEKGQLLKKYIGASGLEVYLNELKSSGVDLLDSKELASRFLLIDLALSKKHLQNLYWPVDFLSISAFDLKDSEVRRNKKLSKIRGIQVISVERSVSRGKR